MKIRSLRCAWILLLAVAPASVHAQALIPGSGIQLTEAGDDFEDVNWSYNFNWPKSSNNIDHQVRGPLGSSANGRLVESGLRGQPDIIKRVETPAGGLPGSKGSLLLQSTMTGIPEHATREMQQDDLIVNCVNRIGQIPVSWSPSCTVRVYLPPFEEWENRTGTSFGFRAGVRTHKSERGKGLFARTQSVEEPYWPGMFVFFNSNEGKGEPDSAYWLIRGNERGGDVKGRAITQTGWWTLGMSFTPDGKVHYYASPGVDNLTQEDYMGSYYPYGYTTERFNASFFNIVSADDGRTPSTAWIIDDPQIFALNYPRTARKSIVQGSADAH